MLDIRKLSKISSECTFILSTIQEIADEWQNELDDVEGNEPEYDSQIDRWQERVDKLTDAVEAIISANENFEQWINNFDAINPCDDKSDEDYSDLKYQLSDIIDDYESAQSNKKGIAKYIKKLKNIASSM